MKNELSSWKEIADYLGVTVRTAQSWEGTRDLPVHRFPGELRGMVRAYVKEIEEWKKTPSASQNGNSTEMPKNPQPNGLETVLATKAPPTATAVTHLPPSNLITRRNFIAGVTATLAVGTTGVWVSTKTSRRSSSYKVERNMLTVFDQYNQVIWQHSFDRPLHAVSYELETRKGWIGNVNDEGTRRVFFIADHSMEVGKQSILYCFDNHGNELWRFLPGREISTANERFTHSYYGSQIRVITIRTGERKVLISSCHTTFYPNQVALLNIDGQLESEYWHSGHLLLMEAVDMNGDGQPEIYLGGVNNEYKAATLVVLNPENLQGVSKQSNPKYQFEGPINKNALARILLPRTCINQRFEDYNNVGYMQIGDSQIIVGVDEQLTETIPTMMYTFGTDLKLQSISPSDTFLAFHKRYEIERKLDHHFRQDELDNLKLTYLP
ncbi:MAG: hypothetical protein DMG65_14245 [Candidatus Angelobacter sp. Gp1-AA117]|nr:MAG: hypothetical protein DMG65_14245 [Candidatus Angelobacter sp. Gp1-AA117]